MADETMTPDNPDTVWANTWNPPTDEWSPSAEPHNTWGVAQPGHGDLSMANPMVDEPGRPETIPPTTGGSVPDVRDNLLTDVKKRMATTPPTQVVHHVVENVERGSEALRFHQEVVQGSGPTTVLNPNDQRKRALLKIAAASGASAQIQGAVANSAGFTYTVPAGQTWSNISSLFWQLVTDATVGNRTLQIIVRDAQNRTLGQYTFVTAQAAALTRQYQSIEGATTDTLAGTLVTYPDIFFGLVMTAGYSLQVVNTGTIGPGDAYTPVLTATITGTGSVFLMPLRDGGGAAAAGIGWQLNPGDPPMEIKSQGGVEAVPAASGGSATIFVYEELVGTAPDQPGISV